MSNIGDYINCYKEQPKGYYLDKSNSLYKKCYYSCKTCEIEGNNITHNCLTCQDTFAFEINKNNYTNCYETCTYYYYFDNEYNFHCTENLSCPEEYPLLINNKSECVNDTIIETEKNIFKSTDITDTIDIYKINENLSEEYSSSDIYQKLNTTIYNDNMDTLRTSLNTFREYSSSILDKEITTIIKTHINTIKIIDIKDAIFDLLVNNKNQTGEISEKEEIKYYNKIIENVEAIFTSENYDTSKLDKGENEIISTEKMIITLTTSQNQKNSINDNMTIIDLGECEKVFRNYYNLSNNELLYIKKIDIKQEGMNIPKVEYDIYSKLSGIKLEKLNISICDNSKISLLIPLIITENIDILDSKSKYYNDICYTTTSESGTDITLKDRKNEYIDGNKMVCQDDCDFSDYNKNIQKVNCSCKPKESSSLFENMKINKTKLFENFVDIKLF